MTTWQTCSSDVRNFILEIQEETQQILKDYYIGFYLHGSLALGGFNPKRSDIDLLVVTNEPINSVIKRKLAELFLNYSSNPYPVEVSVMNETQLRLWEHPSRFDFHYSEGWREKYEADNYQVINEVPPVDPDLAAHITIMNNYGLRLAGPAIAEIFPTIPKSHYKESIIADYKDCLQNIEQNSVYCVLNLLRVYWYLKEEVISSKLEAGEWGIAELPGEYQSTIQKAVDHYQDNCGTRFEREELLAFRNYISDCVKKV